MTNAPLPLDSSAIDPSPRSGNGLDEYVTAILALQRRIMDAQRDRLIQIAGVLAEVVRRDHRIFLFGTGHSHLLAEEGHFRAGGLANVVPILSPGLMLHEGAIRSAQLEKQRGVAAALLDRYQPQTGEVIFIFSNSGVNAVPVEMALAARARGLITIAVCSLRYAQQAALSAAGQRLYEAADYTLDNGGEPGDSLISIAGTPYRVGPSSTITGALIWNALITEVVFQLQARAIDAPVYVSSNLPGAAEHNAALLNKWRSRNPHL